MLSEICAEIKNYFTFLGDIKVGDYAIVDGVVTPSIVIPTDYIRIVGSHKNDGVHVRNAETGKFDDLEDEEKWHGSIWIMSPPKDFLLLVKDIKTWQDKNGSVDSVAMSPFQSESFGGYSYSKGSTGKSTSASGSSVPTWQSTFASRLKIYRRIRL